MKTSNIRFYILILLILNVVLLNAQVSFEKDKSIWLLETDNVKYCLRVIENKLYNSYYGAKVSRESMESYFFDNLEVPVRGGFPNESPILEVIFKDGTRDLDLEYESYSTSKSGSFDLLSITLKDTYYPIKVISHYRVIKEYDIIEKWVEVKNVGKDIIKIENAKSSSLWLRRGGYEMTHYDGIHWHDFQPETSLLTQGVKTIQSKNFKTYGSSFFTIRPQGENDEYQGNVWYGQLHYSGNWKTDFESMYDDKVQISSGINFWDTEWNLLPGKNFVTPVFSFGFTQKGTSKTSQNYADYTRELILPSKRNKTPRPVIYNSWYATEFDVNEGQQLELAKVAKEVGIEMFVIDDGWFKGRVNDKSGLGDWEVDKNKFPNGLNPMIEKINNMGMDFGIWIEPEMVNPNSDLYRKHPDWVLHFANRKRTLGRNQLILNLARQDVFDYLYDSFYKLLKNHNIKYIKWDMNKSLSEPGWPDADPLIQREVRIRYIENVYKLLDQLTTAFPDVWFETCSSGGGRADLGIFKWTDAAWVSDNIDPVDRVLIQYGYLNVFPANTMISWTGYYDNHGVKPSMEFRFDVAMSGVLGIGNDMTKWSQDEIEIAKRKVEEYKKIRETVHNGILYKISSPFTSNRSILQFNDKDDANKSVVFFYQLEDNLKGSSAYPYQEQFIKLRGLDPVSFYRIEGTPMIFRGNDLMNVGVAYPLSKSYTSKIITIIKQ